MQDKPRQVVIPSAGIGSRLGKLTEHINKTMIQIGGKAIISHIIDSYPTNYEFIVCLGHKGESLRQYLEISHPELDITFIDIDKFDGPGSGLGYTLKKTKDIINKPFYFHTNDAIFRKKIPVFENDTIILSTSNVDSRDFRTATINSEKKIIEKLHDKTQEKLEDVYSYTGVAYINEYEKFLEFLEKISINIGESDYFIKNIGGVTEYYLSDDWIDIGSIDGINKAKIELGGFENLNKNTEEIYFIKDKVIKFDINKENINNKIIRSKNLKGLVPSVSDSSDNFFSYKYVEGDLIADLLSPHEVFKEFLLWCENNLWKKINLDKDAEEIFNLNSKLFYYEKTYERINLFHEEYSFFDRNNKINGTTYPKLKDLLDKINWDSIFEGYPCNFHGDLHFENILKTKDDFALIDWRPSYGKLTNVGDLYYDLGKLLHGLWINHKIIRDNHYEIKIEGSNIFFDVYQKKSLIECEDILKQHSEEMGYSWKKVQLIASLILLNIAPLHHDPYSKLLYFYGKEKLMNIIE